MQPARPQQPLRLTAKRLRQMLRLWGAASMRVLLSAATYDLQPSHLYLRDGGQGVGMHPCQLHSTAISPPALQPTLSSQLSSRWLPAPGHRQAKRATTEQQSSAAGTCLLSPSNRSTAAKRCRAASRLVTRADTSRVREVHASYVRLTCPQLQGKTWKVRRQIACLSQQEVQHATLSSKQDTTLPAIPSCARRDKHPAPPACLSAPAAGHLVARVSSIHVVDEHRLAGAQVEPRLAARLHQLLKSGGKTSRGQSSGVK